MLTSGGYHRQSASVVAASIKNLFNLKLISWDSWGIVLSIWNNQSVPKIYLTCLFFWSLHKIPHHFLLLWSNRCVSRAYCLVKYQVLTFLKHVASRTSFHDSLQYLMLLLLYLLKNKRLGRMGILFSWKMLCLLKVVSIVRWCLLLHVCCSFTRLHLPLHFLIFIVWFFL